MDNEELIKFARTLLEDLPDSTRSWDSHLKERVLVAIKATLASRPMDEHNNSLAEPVLASSADVMVDEEESSPESPEDGDEHHPSDWGRGIVPARLERSREAPTPEVLLWSVIRDRTDAIAFNAYASFVGSLLQPPESPQSAEIAPRRGIYSYELLRDATEIFLLSEMGVLPEVEQLDEVIGLIKNRSPALPSASLSAARSETTTAAVKRIKDDSSLERRLGWGPREVMAMRNRFVTLLGNTKHGGLPYFDLIVKQLTGLPLRSLASCCNTYGIIPSVTQRPIFVELIWSYWLEQGMLTQSFKAITNRFQNKKTRRGRDPLAHLELAPLYQLNNVLWGYLQDERSRLTVARRYFEYEHQYGLRLSGAAVPDHPTPVDRRPHFLEAFHNLLMECHDFFQADDNTTVISDAFPVLNALKEIHLILSKGAHNQFGDLPYTARAEMMVEQLLLSQPQLRDFLGNRAMVAYPEAWMGQVDGMKALQGWGNGSSMHFANLASFGEKLLLSIRYWPWNSINDPALAKNWAQYWRTEIQGYVHGYRAVTGVDLTRSRITRAIDITQPDTLLSRRRRASIA